MFLSLWVYGFFGNPWRLQESDAPEGAKQTIFYGSPEKPGL